MTPDEPTVFVVDDERAKRDALQFLIESHGLRAETFASAEEFLAGFDGMRPGCLLLDVHLPGGMSGLELQSQMRELRTVLPVIVMTAYADVAMSVRAMKQGAVEFLQRPCPDADLIAHIRAAIERNMQDRVEPLERLRVQALVRTLTRRERQIMQQVLDGMSSREIAAELSISSKTVETHRAKIMKKIGVSSVLQLINLCRNRLDGV